MNYRNLITYLDAVASCGLREYIKKSISRYSLYSSVEHLSMSITIALRKYIMDNPEEYDKALEDYFTPNERRSLALKLRP